MGFHDQKKIMYSPFKDKSLLYCVYDWCHMRGGLGKSGMDGDLYLQPDYICFESMCGLAEKCRTYDH